ncbi:S8 family serine peptidase [Blastococcus sp. PRF04-17]|uniref:S8 family serine peptidase n=1 Tax=Blastococcus sp. PRF04-17 TaxID=2933797 RepID=UPI00273A044A|nr:S8 family serine peptidase [Blastococcus sp. PRF04-17]
MKSKRVQAVALAGAVVAGYAGAAVFSALAAPAIPIATDFGPDDGLTRIVLTADAGAVDAAMLEALESVDGVVTAQSLDDGRALVATEGLAPHQLAVVPGVAHAEFSVSAPVLGTVTDPYFPQYGWNLENTGTNSYQQPVAAVADADVDATDGWATGTGDGLVIAVTDTGFDTDHPDLAGALWTNPGQPCGGGDTDGNGKAGDCHGWNFYSNNADLDNAGMGSHGTGVSGVVAARAGNGIGVAGVAPQARIMPLVIGGGGSVDVNLGAQAIRYAVDNGADVINASWGGAFTGTALQNLRNAVAYAAAHDVLVVAAAGNDAANRDTNILYPASLTDPNIVTVGSSTAGDTASPSSAYGASNVDLFAPGYLVATTWNDGGYRLVSGTSIAAPHVAAAYALYRAHMPDAGHAELKQAVLDDVDPLPAFSGRSVTGGRLTMSRLAGTPAESVGYAFTSMTAPAGLLTPGIGVSGPTAAGAYEVVLGLGMEHAGEIWALADKDITLDGVTVATDDAGDAAFPLGTFAGSGSVGLTPAMELGDGRYVLTVQLYRDGEPVGRTHAAPLLVGAAVPAPGDETPTDGAAPGGGTAPGGTTPDAGTQPGGTAPGGAPPGTGTPPPAAAARSRRAVRPSPARRRRPAAPARLPAAAPCPATRPSRAIRPSREHPTRRAPAHPSPR